MYKLYNLWNKNANKKARDHEEHRLLKIDYMDNAKLTTSSIIFKL